MSIPHVAIYRRVSTTVQADDGISLDNQPVMVVHELEKRFGKGGFTYEIFTDEGKSGDSGPMPWATVRKPRDRRGLFEMIQRLSAREFTHVAAYHPDRIYRDHLGHMALYSEVMKPRGIQFVFVTGSFDTTNEGLFAQGVIAGVAELQRHQISENIRRNLECKRKEGYYLGTVPFGWRREDASECPGRRTNIAPVPEECEVVIRIKDMYLSGMSTQAIATALNREGVSHKRSVGKWQNNTVAIVLTNPTHVGLVRQPDGSLAPGLHYEYRIYDGAVLAQIMDRLERNRKRLKGVAHTQPFRLFNGIAFCGHCGKRLQGSFHTKSPGYRCLRNGSSDDGSHVYISASALEELIVAELGVIARSPEVQAEIEEKIESLIRSQDDELRKRLVKIRAALKEIDDKTGRIVDAIASGVLSNVTARKQIQGLEESAQKLREDEVGIEVQLSASARRTDQVRAAKLALHRFTDVWEYLRDAERREALHIAIERLEVFARDERKWIRVKFVFSEEPIEIEVLRGAERYRSGKLDGAASLTARELAALKHTLDGADYVLIARYFESSPTNAFALLNRAWQKLGVEASGSRGHREAARVAELHIRRVHSQLPLFGKATKVKYSATKLKTMEYQVLILTAEGKSEQAISAHTRIDVERVSKLLNAAIKKLDRKTAKAALKRLEAEEEFLPISMKNRRRIG
ncbi:recombinase family protein [Kamptonema cortianum]|nr:recombinase family protein [Geitlerinema splendidum]MDK3157111.1 recombinase family protein [Kamptonema cortianum]